MQLFKDVIKLLSITQAFASALFVVTLQQPNVSQLIIVCVLIDYCVCIVL